MITKVTEPIIEKSPVFGSQVIGSQTEYRLCGILLMRKVVYTPEKYGIRNRDNGASRSQAKY
ncbi:hypothetical protein [Dysgonomonas termitidis]|uniref:Transposase n=1 Tax=Dysgonomonas termitidis TaxID=1516126 RepID=A0ABV9KU74_9BACT